MAFTQSCFIRKNTPELRKKLRELGYKELCNGHDMWYIPINELPYLVTYPWVGSYMGTTGYWYDTDIDCEENEKLFLALVALRDDTDINQWFIMDCDVYLHINKGDWFISTDINKGKHIGTQIDPMYCHKATVEEIIEHFKNK